MCIYACISNNMTNFRLFKDLDFHPKRSRKKIKITRHIISKKIPFIKTVKKDNLK